MTTTSHQISIGEGTNQPCKNKGSVISSKNQVRMERKFLRGGGGNPGEGGGALACGAERRMMI